MSHEKKVQGMPIARLQGLLESFCSSSSVTTAAVVWPTGLGNFPKNLPEELTKKPL